MPDDGFRFAYDPPVLRSGRGCVADLSAELATHGLERALVVCGTTVGETPAVMDPVTDGLGDRLAGTFAGTTPEKRLDTALDARVALREHDADAIVALGGGSSLDVAKATSVLAAGDQDRDAAAAAFAETGTLAAPSGDLVPIVAVPTTLAGADLSMVAGLTADPEGGLVEEPVGGGIADPRLMPAAVAYDPELFATTPASVLAGSAMNGFDKGVETLYARNRTPVTDATAARGLRLLADGLRELGDEGPSPSVLAPVVEGIMLVQYGIGRPDGTTLSLIHAFGHGITASGSVQQGAAHAVVAPHALRYLFEQVDGRRAMLAEALGVADAEDHAAAVVEAVTAVRDALELPTRLRDVDGPARDELDAVAEHVLADAFVANVPEGLEPTAAELAGVLEEAY